MRPESNAPAFGQRHFKGVQSWIDSGMCDLEIAKWQVGIDMSAETTTEIRDAIRSVFRGKPVKQVDLFGSAARGEIAPDSDVDLLVTPSYEASNEPSAPIHPKAYDLVERQGKTGNLSHQFADLLAAAGLRQKRNHKSRGKGRGTKREVQPLSFHSLRRTATTLLHEAGVPVAVAQALIGHDSEAMHELYVSVGREALGKPRLVCLKSKSSKTASDLV